MSFVRRALLCTILGTALWSGAAAAQQSLLVGTSATPRHFNGAIQSGTATAIPSTQIFASLLRHDSEWNPQPYLAERWETSDDGLTVTLHLVEGATFHDGEPITSGDVAFSIRTVKEHHPFTTMLAPVSNVETPDERTVVIRLTHPHPALLLAMSPALLPILPEHVYGEGDIQQNPANLNPVGSGPFRFVEYRQGEYIRLAKNETFFIEGRPLLDEIVIQIFNDPANLALSIERGDVEFAPFLSNVRDIKRLEEAANVTVSTEGGDAIGPINWLAFNTKKAPFDDVRVRHAIAHAINKDFYLDRLMGGIAVDVPGPITPASPLATEDVERYPFDLERAAQLLDEAGLAPGPDGNRFSMTVDYIPAAVDTGRNLAEYLRTQLRSVGIHVEVRTAPDFPTWSQRIANYDFDVTQDSVFNWGDPVIGVNRTYLSSNIRPGVIWSNTQQYRNPRVDELLIAAAQENDPAKRAELYREFQQIVVADAPILFLSSVPYASAHKAGLEGLPTTIWGAFSPWDEMHWAR